MVISSSSLRPRRLQAAEPLHPEAGRRAERSGGRGRGSCGRPPARLLGKGWARGACLLRGCLVSEFVFCHPARPSSASPKTSCVGGPADLDSFYDLLQGDLGPVPSPIFLCLNVFMYKTGARDVAVGIKWVNKYSDLRAGHSTNTYPMPTLC